MKEKNEIGDPNEALSHLEKQQAAGDMDKQKQEDAERNKDLLEHPDEREERTKEDI
jgi:hypothetical protein